MSRKRVCNRGKRLLAFLLAAALFFNGWINYDFRVEAAEGDLIVTLNTAEIVYDGQTREAAALISTVVQKDNNEELTAENYTVSVTKDGQPAEICDAGAYEITVTQKDSDPVKSGSADFTVNALDLSTQTMLINGKAAGYESDFVYTGTEIKPEAALENVPAHLYQTEVTGATNAGGQVTIAITPADGLGANVTGEITKEISIIARSIDDATVNLQDAEKTFTSAEDANQPVVVSITLADGTGLPKESFADNGLTTKIAAADGTVIDKVTEPGTYKVQVTGSGNYTGTAEAEYHLSYGESPEGLVTLDGNTLENNVFADEVNLKVCEGYRFLENQETKFTESQSGGVEFKVENEQTFEIISDRTDGFTIDKEAPELTLSVPEGQDNNIWTTEKTISAVATDENLHRIYYAENDVLGNTKMVSEIPVELQQLNGNSLIVSEEIKGTETYYFYAIDKAGRVTKAEQEIGNIDISDPLIEGIDSAKTYWKNADDRELEFKVSDMSGIGANYISLQVKGADGTFADAAETDAAVEWTYDATDSSIVTGGKITVKKPGVYKLTAADKVSHTVEAEFTVKQDSSTPVLAEIADNAINGTNKYKANDEAKDEVIFWFSSSEGVTVDVSVTNEAVSEEEVSENKVLYSSDENFADAKTIELTADQEGTQKGKSEALELKENADAKTYYFKAVDEAGNESAVQKVTLAVDTKEPVVKSCKTPQDANEDGWLNEKEVNKKEGVKIEFELEVSEQGCGINPDTLFYNYNDNDGVKHSVKPTDVKVDELPEEKGTYKVTFSVDELPDGVIKAEDWNIVLQDHVENTTTNIGQGNIRIDTLAPEDRVYIKFFTDTKGENEGASEAEKDDGLWYQISGWFADQWNKLWGKEKIEFEVYVRDNMKKTTEVSGFSETPTEALEMSYLADGDKERTKIENLKFISGLKASFEDGNQTYEGYTVYEGSITIDKDSTLKVSDFQIDRLEDCAGNISENIKLGSAEDSGVIYLDSVSPKLTDITIDSENVNLKERYYYNDKKSVTLTIDERFFEETKAKPTVTVLRRCTGGNTDDQSAEVALKNFEDVTTEIEISDWSKGENPHSATVTLPKEDGKEYEYQIQVSYTDASDNKLEGINVENGVFTSKIFVVDGIAPTLKYRVNPAGNCTVDGAAVYKNAENDDLEVTITIDDNETYYEAAKSNLTAKVYRKDKAEAVKVKELKISEDSAKKVDALNPEQENGRIHEYSFRFDGAPSDSENEYYVTVSYADAAGNQLIKDPAKDSVESGCEIANGTYMSKSYIIDHVAPEFTSTYNDAFRIVKDKDHTDVDDKQPQDDCTAYYNDTIKATYTVTEKYTNENEDHSPKHCVLKITKDKKEIETEKYQEYVKWTAETGADEKTVYKATVTIPKKDDHSTDGDYKIILQSRDCAGNKMAAEAKKEVHGEYTSPILVLDTTAPELKTYYKNADNKKIVEPIRKDGRDYFNAATPNIVFGITITDRNIRYGELAGVLDDAKITDIKNGTVDGKFATDIGKIGIGKIWHSVGTEDAIVESFEFSLATDANYKIEVKFTDLAGNKAVIDPEGSEHDPEGSGKFLTEYTELVTFDKEKPNIKVVKDADGLMAEDSDIQYEVINNGKFAHIINKLTFGYFAKEKIRVTITAHDDTSGVQDIYYTYDGEDGQVAKEQKLTLKAADRNDPGKRSGSFELPISFKGQITAYAVDVAENSAKDCPSGGIGVIVENAAMHEDRSAVSVKVISNYSKTPDYYNGDVAIRFTSQDSYSGIRSIDYLAGNDLKETDTSFDEAGDEITAHKITRDYTIRSASNNENDIQLGLSLLDNAGHTRKVPKNELPKIHIDATDPKVTVEYDNNDFQNEKYYKEDRTATVTVEERNFDPGDVNFELTGPRPSISDWRHIAGSGCHGGSDPSNTGHTDSCKWVCEVYFHEDGDYTFGFSCKDLAGNEGSYGQVDDFVIDKTMPEMKVEYDNHDVQNDFYYNAPRRATITITEHNFDAGDVQITMTAKDDGRTRTVPAVSGWSAAGDVHRATIDFDYDAEFTFDIAYEDLAGNEAEDYTEDHFVVDLTVPELEIFDIIDRSANNGEVRPGIRYHDTNYDPDGTQIHMIGYHNGVQEMTGTRNLEAKGLELKLDDFPYVPESDDMYTMEATVYDLAGNSSEASVMFSVNRFGSVYTFDEATEKLVGADGRYYTNEEQDLVVYETNVDTLEFKEITCNFNGKLQTLKEGDDYLVDVSGSDVTWKQYTYKLLKENFTEEGTYIITIYSEDRATNVSDNNTKEKKIEFVVDKTDPSILISGVEDGEQYLEDSRKVTLDVQDNIRMSEVKVILNGKESVYDAAQLAKTDGKISLTVKSANSWQTLQTEIADAAGNTVETEEIRFLITANIFVQFFMNKPLFYGTIAALLAAGGGFWWFIVGKKKKKENEEA